MQEAQDDRANLICGDYENRWDCFPRVQYQ